MTRDQADQYYQGLGQDLVELWTKPLLNSRGGAATQEGDNIVVQECLDVMETEFPDLVGIIDHIGGATEEGDGEVKVRQKHLYNAVDSKSRSGFSRPDTAFGGIFNGEKFEAFINTASRKVGGGLIKWEKISLARLIINAKGAFAEAMSKLKKDSDGDEFRKEARDVCRRAMTDLQRQIKELKK